MAAATGVLWILHTPLGLDKAHVGLVYLLVVAACAAVGGTAPALVAAVGAFLAWNFFFLPPYHTLVLADPRDWFLLFAFLVIAALVGQMTGRVRAREEDALAHSRENAALYVSSMAAGRHSEPLAALPTLLEQIVRGASVRGAVVLRPANGSAEVLAAAGEVEALPCADDVRLVAFVTHEVKAVGLDARHDGELDEDGVWPVSVPHETVLDRAPERRDVWLPLTYGTHAFGALRVAVSDARVSMNAQRLLVAFASHVAATLERARLLEEMRSAAHNQETERLKSVLFSSLSHNLKTPLASLSATISSVLAEDVVFDRGALRESLELMAEDLSRLTDHIENLLSLAQLEAGAWQPQLEWIEINEVVSVALRLLPPPDRRRIRVDTQSASALVRADATQMAQVLRHLVENALAYSPPDSPVDLRAVEDGPRMKIIVDDRGPGIAKEEAERVFRKFYRGEHALRSSVRGTGLGLAICKEIVDAHRGSLSVEQAEGGGTRMVVTLEAGTPPKLEMDE